MVKSVRMIHAIRRCVRYGRTVHIAWGRLIRVTGLERDIE